MEMGADFGVDGRRRKKKLGEGRPYSRCSGGQGRRRCCKLAAAAVADYNVSLQNSKNRAVGGETLASAPVRWRWRCSEDLG